MTVGMSAHNSESVSFLMTVSLFFRDVFQRLEDRFSALPKPLLARLAAELALTLPILILFACITRGEPPPTHRWKWLLRWLFLSLAALILMNVLLL